MVDIVTKVSVGAIITETLAISRRNLRAFAIVGVLLAAVPQLALAVLQKVSPQGEMVWVSGLAGLVIGLTAIFAQAGLMFAALEDQRGRRLSVGEILAAGRKAFPGVFMVGLVVGLLSSLGMVLLFVPGLILAAMWSVAPVVQVARDKGLNFSLRQSSDLTRGNRWRILGLLLIYVLALVAAYVVIGALALAGGPTLVAISEVVVAPFQTVLASTGCVALYLALDRAKGGLNSATVAATFD